MCGGERSVDAFFFVVYKRCCLCGVRAAMNHARHCGDIGRGDWVVVPRH